MKDSDHSYKLLFSHPEMVADLLRGYVKEEWVQRVDFSTLEKVSGSYVSDDLREREDDAVWRVRLADEWLYVYLLLEFQSKVDRFMAVRMMTNLGLLYQDLVRSKGLTASGKLPPVLPVVLYNGDARWNAAENIGELVESIPGGLARYRPSLTYLLLDEGALMERGAESTRNLVTALFRLEKSRDKGDILSVVENLIEWLSQPGQAELRRAFSVWMNRVMTPPEDGLDLELEGAKEATDMLSKRMEEWRQEAREQGLREGREEGREEGARNGMSLLLVKMMETRFGEVSPSVVEKIGTLGSATLSEMAERILVAGSVAEVLGDPPAERSGSSKAPPR